MKINIMIEKSYEVKEKMRKKLTSILLAALICTILLCGCGKDAETDDESSRNINTEVDEAVLENSQETRENTQAEDGDATEIEDEKETVVEAGLEDAETKISEAPNLACETQYDYYYNDDESVLLLLAEYDTLTVSGEGYEALSEAVTAWNDEENSDFLSYCKELSEDAAENTDASANSEYTNYYESKRQISVTRASTGVLSLKMFNYAYLGGTHGDYSYTCKTFDAKNGDALELEDLLNINNTAEFYDVAGDYIVEKLEAEHGDELFDGYEDVVYSMWDDDLVWYLDPEGIAFVFNAYEIGPYAMGSISVTCPYEEFGEYLMGEYFDYDEAGIYELGTNIDTKTTQGILNVSEVINSEYDMYTVSVTLDGETLEMGDFGTFGSAYLLTLSDGRAFVIIDADYMSDDYVTALYEITDGTLSEKSYLEGVSLEEGTIGTDSMTLSVHLDVLGTYSAFMVYNIDDKGELSKTQEIFEIPQDDEEWHLLTLVKDLSVTMDGKETTLTVGSQIRITGTDNNGTAYFKVEGTGETGSISYERGTGDDEWQLYIDGVSEYDYFEMLPYAG